jgi:hypothetical protein
MALVVGALTLVAVRFVIITNFQPKWAIFTILALVIWSSIGWGIRALLRWRERARLKALLARQS